MPVPDESDDEEGGRRRRRRRPKILDRAASGVRGAARRIRERLAGSA
jgi:hypothetical protein